MSPEGPKQRGGVAKQLDARCDLGYTLFVKETLFSFLLVLLNAPWRQKIANNYNGIATGLKSNSLLDFLTA